MESSLSNLFDDLAEGIYEIKCRYGRDNNKCEICVTKYKDCEFCLEYTNVKDDLIEYKYLCCNKKYQKEMMKT